MEMRQDLRVRWGAAIVLLLVFSAGAAIGFAYRGQEASGAVEAAPVHVNAGASAQPPNEWVIDRLDLTGGQRAAVDSVIDHYGARMSRLQKEYRPRYRALVDSTVHDLRALLTQEQRVRYDSLAAASERWRQREEARSDAR